MTKIDDIPFFATVPVHLEELLTSELTALGAHEPRPTRAGVAWRGDAETAQRVLLWSRLASRLLATIGEGPAPNADALFESLRALPWERHLPTGIPFAVDFVGHNAALRDSRYSARLSKDAIRARFTDLGLPPPEARPAAPGIRCNIRLAAQRATASVDLSGTSLHRRGYRSSARDAPLKENLAAALLLRAGWPAIAAEGGTFLDPFCGSGTLAIEAALMAADIAPGLIRREEPAIGHWLGFEAEAQERLLAQARQRARTGRGSAPRLLASDSDPAAVATARANAAGAGVSELIDFTVQAWEGRDRPPQQQPGLMVTNPPWGWRLEANRPIEGLYMDIGDRARRLLPGWRLAVFTGGARLLSALGLRARADLSPAQWAAAGAAGHLRHRRGRPPPRGGAPGGTAGGLGQPPTQEPPAPQTMGTARGPWGLSGLMIPICPSTPSPSISTKMTKTAIGGTSTSPSMHPPKRSTRAVRRAVASRRWPPCARSSGTGRGDHPEDPSPTARHQPVRSPGRRADLAGGP
ncbi:MAG: hypothetical protein U5L11_05505 [Arhodomonas sp.]|nr:hypothetical protein [Arhodomonas sp.]